MDYTFALGRFYFSIEKMEDYSDLTIGFELGFKVIEYSEDIKFPKDVDTFALLIMLPHRVVTMGIIIGEI